ncbi:interferon-inducible GTPase 1-like [Anomaloglossus baeobatrachus]
MNIKNPIINIAIMGESGSGKSTFVNAIRGLHNDEEENAAKTGIVETTMEPTAYPHPKHSDMELAKKICSMKKFYFVRNKIDTDLKASKLCRHRTYNERRILHEIRDNCITSLRDRGVEEPIVFLLSCLEMDKYDFELLVETLEKERL